MKTLIVDCGATTCLYNVLLPDGTIVRYRSKGYSPISDTLSDFPQFTEISSSMDEIYFFCTSLRGVFLGQAQKLLQSRFPQSTVFVYSDSEAAAIACYGHSKGYIHIIGTGSSMNYWDGERLTFPKVNLGYLWEDYASGYDITKTMIRYWKNGFMNHEDEAYLEQHFGTLSEFISLVYQAGSPKLFLAQASKKVHGLTEETRNKIINERLQEYFTKNIDIFTDREAHSFVGSIAYAFKSEIEKFMTLRNLETGAILENTMTALTTYYHKSKMN